MDIQKFIRKIGVKINKYEAVPANSFILSGMSHIICSDFFSNDEKMQYLTAIAKHYKLDEFRLMMW